MLRLPKRKKTTSEKSKKPVKNTQRSLLLARRKKIIEQIVKNKEKKKISGTDVPKIEPISVSPPHAHAQRGHEVMKRRQELPPNYGDNHIYLLVRDTHWLYAYWEIQKDHQERCLVLQRGLE